MQISAGKLWSMRRLADERGFFKMTAVDQRPGGEALVRQRRGPGGAGVRLVQDVRQVQRVLIENLSPWSSAMLLHPGYAYPRAALQADPRKGLLLTYQQWDCEEKPRRPK